MTKPIEGWVAVSAENTRRANIPVYLHKQPGLDYRPVRITFTDEADVMQKRLEGE